MLRWLLGKLAVKPLIKEDPYFRLQVDEDLNRNLARVTVTIIRSSANWRGKFKVESRAGFPLEIQVPDAYKRDNEYFVLTQDLTEKNEVTIELKATPLRTGTASVRFWFERKVGVGGQIAVVGTILGQGDQEAVNKNREFVAKHWNRWLEDNPDWPDTDLK